MKKNRKEKFIPYDSFKSYLDGGLGKVKTESLDDHGFIWENGRILCMTCDGKSINEPRRMKRHIAFDTHKRKLKAKSENKVKKSVTLDQLKRTRDDTYRQYTIPPDIQAYRCEALKEVAKANISFKSFGDMSQWIDRNSKSHLSIGTATDLSRAYSETVLQQLIEEFRVISTKCYPEYGIIFDGTPTFAEAEAIKIRFVTFENEIVEVLVRLALFDKKLNAENLAGHLLETIMLRLGLKLENWTTTQQDRASTNKSAITKIKERHEHAKPTENDCCSHTLSNAGHELIKEVNIKHCFNFRKRYQKVIQYPGKARELASKCIGESVKVGSGPRFFLHYEQIVQIVTYGLDKVVKNIARVCAERKWSEKSSKKLLDDYDEDKNKGKLAMAIFEGSVVKDVGRILCTSCYTLEGDSPLILTAAEVFKVIDECCIDGFNIPSLHKIAQDTSMTLNEIYTPILNQKAVLQSDIDNKKVEIDLVQHQIQTIQANIDATTQHTSGRGRVSRRTNISINNDRVQLLEQSVNDKSAEYDELAKEVEKAESKLTKHMNIMEEWNKEFPNITVEDLIQHGRSIAQPALNYYTRNFNQEDGDIYRLKRAARASQIFNPFVLQELDIASLELLIDDLANFEYRHFTKNFLNKMKKEVPLAIEHANKIFDWESIKSTKQYKTRLDNRRKRRKLDDNHQFDWKSDPGEKANRIFEW